MFLTYAYGFWYFKTGHNVDKFLTWEMCTATLTIQEMCTPTLTIQEYHKYIYGLFKHASATYDCKLTVLTVSQACYCCGRYLLTNSAKEARSVSAALPMSFIDSSALISASIMSCFFCWTLHSTVSLPHRTKHLRSWYTM